MKVETRRRAEVASLLSCLGVGCLLAIVGLSGLPGCKKEKNATCEDLYKKLSSCTKSGRIDREGFLRDCRKRIKEKPSAGQALRCARESSCKAFSSCMEKVRIDRMRKELEHAEKSGDYDMIAGICHSSKARRKLGPECVRAVPAAYRALSGKLEKERESALAATASQKPRRGCSGLHALARAIGPKAHQKAEALCEELRLARKVGETIAEVERALDRGRGRLPGSKTSTDDPPRKKDPPASAAKPSVGRGAGMLGVLSAMTSSLGVLERCKSLGEELDKLGTLFAGQAQKKLYAACYGRLGQKILTGATGCDYRVRNLLKTIKKLKLTDPALLAAAAAARKCCDTGGDGDPGSRLGKPRVTTNPGTIVGGLDVAIIRRVIRRHLPEIKYCYLSRGLSANPRLQGMVKVSFTITSIGSVGQVAITASTLNHGPTEGCIKAAVRRWRFPRPEGGMPFVTYPFHFKPGR